jgi:hypothetical protein
VLGLLVDGTEVGLFVGEALGMFIDGCIGCSGSVGFSVTGCSVGQFLGCFHDDTSANLIMICVG